MSELNPGRFKTLSVTVRDNGDGLPERDRGEGFGTQIVRTLSQGELEGAIDWHALDAEDTRKSIEIPLWPLHHKML